jgi:hypothetical protein
VADRGELLPVRSSSSITVRRSMLCPMMRKIQKPNSSANPSEIPDWASTDSQELPYTPYATAPMPIASAPLTARIRLSRSRSVHGWA